MLHLSGVVCARVPPDCLDGQVQAAGAFAQAGALAEQVVDLLPALQFRLCALAVLQRCRAGPAGGVRRDLLPDGLAEAVPQVPAVADLDRGGSARRTASP